MLRCIRDKIKGSLKLYHQEDSFPYHDLHVIDEKAL